MTSTHIFKLAIIGDGSTGKTTFIDKYLPSVSVFEKRYIATMGVRVHPIRFKTNKGDVIFICWDITGQKKFVELGQGYYINSDAALVFFDLSSKFTLDNTLYWQSKYSKVCKSTPVVLCGNKNDLKSQVDATNIDTGKFDGYCELSVKTGSNYKKPFLKVLKLLMGSDTEIITI
uniref:Ras family GTPase n=1 Tax=Pithovirus LCPAC001 TaxID=2506585 RepID=A0A481Z1K2_9VIRU|nr:MAG: Ras family GTPase [Pithovirus LCPAC001]